MKQLLTRSTAPPSTEQLWDVLLDLQADGSPGAVRLSAVLTVFALLTSPLFRLALSADTHTAISRAVYEWMPGTDCVTTLDRSDGGAVREQPLPADGVDNNNGTSAAPTNHHLPPIVRRIGAFMRRLHTPHLGPPATGDLVAILASLQAAGSEGARALSAAMANTPVGAPLGSEALSALDRAVYEWMAGTLSEGDIV
jgi:hypothetical protein